MTFGQDPGSFLQGATNCPHCGGLAHASPHAELRYVCNLCGAPRIEPQGKGVKLSGREKRPLTEARQAQRARAGWRSGGVFAGVTGGLAFLLFTLLGLIFGVGMGLGVTALVVLTPLVLLLAAAISKSKSKTADIKRALDEAWKSAARDLVLANPRGLAAADLAQALGLQESEAEQLIAELSVDNQVTSRLAEDGRIILEPLTGARIDAGADAAASFADPLEARFAELERQQAEEEQAGTARRKP